MDGHGDGQVDEESGRTPRYEMAVIEESSNEKERRCFVCDA